MASVRIKICGDHRARRRRLAWTRAPDCIGMIFWPRVRPRVRRRSRRGAIAARMRRERASWSACSSTSASRASSRSPTSLGLDDGAAPRRRGPGVLRRGREADGREVIKAVRVRDRGDVSGLEPFHTRLPPARRRRRRVVRLGRWSRCAAARRPGRSSSPAGSTPANVGEAIATRAALGGRRRQRGRERAGRQGPRAGARVHRRCRGGCARPGRGGERVGGHGMSKVEQASRTASGPTAAATCPRR